VFYARWLVGGAVLLALCGVLGYLLYAPQQSSTRAVAESENGPSHLPEEVGADDYHQAKLQFESRYRKEASHYDVLSWLGEANFRDERWAIASACFSAIPDDTPRYGHIARLYEGRALLKMDRVRPAERSLRKFLELEIDSPNRDPAQIGEALFQLSYLLGIELRFEDRKAVHLALLQLNLAELEEVLNYCFPSLHRWNGTLAAKALEKFWQADPEDPRLRVALGRYRTGQGRTDEALAILQQCRQDFPKSLTTAGALLACLHERGDWAEMAAIMATLPSPTDTEPWQLLRMRGHFHNHAKQFDEALDCFHRVLKGDAADAESYLGLGAAYAGKQDREKQQAALDTARHLSRIQNRIGWALDQPDDPEALVAIAEVAAEIGLEREAAMVVQYALKRHAGHAALVELQRRLQPKESPQ
jgi:tetratricopeptide (TPR) repeat protein